MEQGVKTVNLFINRNIGVYLIKQAIKVNEMLIGESSRVILGKWTSNLVDIGGKMVKYNGIENLAGRGVGRVVVKEPDLVVIF